MSCYIGFDPGGSGAFGWCVVLGNGLPLNIITRGIANDAQQAVNDSLQAIGAGTLCGAAFDSPLFWRSAGDRIVDDHLRQRVLHLGAHGGTVNHVNSLRGACLIQGMLAAMLLRQHNSGLLVSESHPKAMLWLLGIADANNPVSAISLGNLGRLFAGNTDNASDHERDAALGALSAWAMSTKPHNWQNLYPLEVPNPISPLSAPLGYWMPQEPDSRRLPHKAFHGNDE
jgi:hypothetical protein